MYTTDVASTCAVLPSVEGWFDSSLLLSNVDLRKLVSTRDEGLFDSSLLLSSVDSRKFVSTRGEGFSVGYTLTTSILFVFAIDSDIGLEMVVSAILCVVLSIKIKK